jgi:nitrite reductase/ring-hydroxylating ferredoxin subunit
MRVTLTEDQRRAIARGRFVRVGAAWGGAIVGRVDGAWKAFENVCRHRALPLDLGASSPMSDDGAYLLCHQHGALYRPTDGRCVVGPCVGESLTAVEVRETEEEGTLEVLLPSVPPVRDE